MNGRKWEMDFIENDGDVWFTNGWSEFAQHHSLKNGQLLFFKDAGFSQFDVVILGKNGLEINYPVLNSAQFNESDIDDGSDDDDDDVSPCLTKDEKPMPPTPYC